MLEGHIMQIWSLVGSIRESDFIVVVRELCKGAFIAGQKAAVDEMKELIK